jgi:hypothetical protein
MAPEFGTTVYQETQKKCIKVLKQYLLKKSFLKMVLVDNLG